MFIIISKNWRRLVFVLIILLIIIDTSQIALFAVAKAVVSTVSGRLIPIYSVLTSEPFISLTFESGSGKDMTCDILEVLEIHNVKATFFLSGEWMEQNKNSVKKIIEKGHEFGNYTYSTPHPNALNRSSIKRELEKAHKYIESTTGSAPKVFRPPYGEYSNKVIEVSKELQYETIIWNIDSLDWRGASSDIIVDRILERLKPGAIVRFHVTGGNTPEAMLRVINLIKEKGYEILPLSDLLLKGDYYIHPHTGEMRPIYMPSASWGERRHAPDEA